MSANSVFPTELSFGWDQFSNEWEWKGGGLPCVQLQTCPKDKIFELFRAEVIG